YTETLSAGNTNNPYNFNSFTYGNTLNVTGEGINMKLGAIWKPTNFLRFGAAIHLPTYYSLNEVFTPNINSQVNGYSYNINSYSTPIGSQFNYNLLTPWKSVLSAT